MLFNTKVFVIATLLIIANIASAANPIECGLCDFVVTKAEQYLATNHTVTELETYLDKACDYFGKYSTICTDYVNQYLPNIITDIEDKYEPSEICQMLHACANNDKELEVFTPCEVCQMIVLTFEEILQSNQTMTKLEETLISECDKLPAYTTECINFVTGEFPVIVDDINKYLGNNNFCEEIGLCTSC